LSSIKDLLARPALLPSGRFLDLFDRHVRETADGIN
jgi:hypothetical protein